MGYFPFFTDVKKCHGVIVGGGRIASEKIERLLHFDANLTVVAPSICDAIKKHEDQLDLIERAYESSDLDGADYVVAATNISSLNESVYTDAKNRHLLINVVDEPERCDFIFPAVLKRGKLVVGVSTSGAGPQAAVRLRKKIEETVPDNIEEILDILANERIKAKEEIKDESQRRKYLIDLADSLLGYKK